MFGLGWFAGLSPVSTLLFPCVLASVPFLSPRATCKDRNHLMGCWSGALAPSAFDSVLFSLPGLHLASRRASLPQSVCNVPFASLTGGISDFPPQKDCHILLWSGVGSHPLLLLAYLFNLRNSLLFFHLSALSSRISLEFLGGVCGVGFSFWDLTSNPFLLPFDLLPRRWFLSRFSKIALLPTSPPSSTH